MQRKILVVDDSHLTRLQVRSALTRRGFEVFEAADGMAAIGLVMQHPDLALIISDVNMPGLGGLDLLQFLKGHERYSTLPVLVMTMDGVKDLATQVRRLKAQALIMKPLRTETLVEAVERLTQAA